MDFAMIALIGSIACVILVFTMLSNAASQEEKYSDQFCRASLYDSGTYNYELKTIDCTILVQENRTAVQKIDRYDYKTDQYIGRFPS